MKYFKQFLLMAALSSAIQADTLRLRDGRVFQGEFLGASKTQLWFERQPQADAPSTVVVPLASVESLIFDLQTRPTVNTDTNQENQRMFNREQSAGPSPAFSMNASGGTVIGETMLIKGNIFSQEPLLVNGAIEGQIESDAKLTVGPTGKAIAGIKAREVMIAGTVEGDVDVAERIVLAKGANLTGDVKTAGIVIEDGAYFKGGIDITRPPATAAQSSAQPQPK